MIDHAAARARLMEIATDAFADVDDDLAVTVYPNALDAIPAFPLVVGGQPRWEDIDQPAMEKTTFPVAVVVARPGGNDGHVQTVLELLWPQLTQGYQQAVLTDQTLGGICRAANVARAEFGQFDIQGQGYPAQLIHLELFG